jgi:hypothetical protein
LPFVPQLCIELHLQLLCICLSDANPVVDCRMFDGVVPIKLLLS